MHHTHTHTHARAQMYVYVCLSACVNFRYICVIARSANWLCHVCLSPILPKCLHLSAWLQLGGFSWNLMLGSFINPFKAELNPICHLLALLGAHPIFLISRIRVKLCWENPNFAEIRQKYLVPHMESSVHLCGCQQYKVFCSLTAPLKWTDWCGFMATLSLLIILLTKTMCVG
jgi:hypothetical protein